MTRIDHTACAHPRTPTGRRACRAGRSTPAFGVGDTVTQLESGAVGTVTRVIAPTVFHESDGSPQDGKVWVTFPTLRFPKVQYGYGSVGSFIRKS